MRKLKQASGHITITLFYVVGGKKKRTTLNGEYFVKDGQAIFIKKGAYIAHKYFDEDFCALLIFVPDDFIQTILQQQSWPQLKSCTKTESDSIIPLAMDESLSSYFHSVLSYFIKSSPPPKYLLKIKFTELLIHILIDAQNRQLASYFSQLYSNGKILIPEIMESNFTRSLTLEEFAKLCGRSLSTFKRDFYQLYNTSPGKWLTKMRLNFGKCLLETTEKSINDIAYESGFQNTGHFIRIFKESYGKPPL